MITTGLDGTGITGLPAGGSTASTGSSNLTLLSKKSSSSDYVGHDKKEVTRLIIQALRDMDYKDVAEKLEQDSHYTTEAPEVARFRAAVLQGEWDNVEQLLSTIELHPSTNTEDLLFLIRRQRFLELLEAGQRQPALMLLRHRLTPLQCNREELHQLSNLVCFSIEDIKTRIGWDGSTGKSRSSLLWNLQQYFSPAIMIPPFRLGALLTQAKQYQLSRANYWVNDEQFSLYRDFPDDRNRFPTETVYVLNDHNNEVWYLDFSHNGKYLASSSLDKTVIVWDVKDFSIVATLIGHEKGVMFMDWSPDDQILLTSGQDARVILWDPMTGKRIRTIKAHDDVVGCCVWLPNGEEFLTGSPDKEMILFNVSGQELYRWSGPRVISMAVTPDGSKLIAIDIDNKLHFYDLVTRKKITEIGINSVQTSVSVSRDSRYALVNVVPEEIHMWDLKTFRIARKYVGQEQKEFIIRSCFGGLHENFILSGSQDSHIYVWNRETANLIDVLPGHVGTINCVKWNPAMADMFASAGDDGTIRIWRSKASIGNK